MFATNTAAKSDLYQKIIKKNDGQTQFCSKMLALERILGKDVLSIICEQLHRTYMQALNEEFVKSVRLPDGVNFMFWKPCPHLIELAYNFRKPPFDPQTICDKYGKGVAELPKNY